MDYLISLGVKLKFNNVSNESFRFNLMLVDTQLSLVVAEILKCFYAGRGSSIVDLLQLVSDGNILNLLSEEAKVFYAYKVKELLTNIALGMVPATKWTGWYEANGGYIIVKDDGEILCYHIYNRNEFREYLLKNTKLETPSTSRHKFGVIETIDKKQYLKLNLQIRFIK